MLPTHTKRQLGGGGLLPTIIFLRRRCRCRLLLVHPCHIFSVDGVVVVPPFPSHTLLLSLPPVLILKVAQPEDPPHLIPLHIHPPLDQIRGVHDAVLSTLIDHQVEGAICGGHRKAETVLSHHCCDGRVGGNLEVYIRWRHTQFITNRSIMELCL